MANPPAPHPRPLVLFLVLAFALSWAVAWPLAASARGWIPWHLSPALHLLIGLGPGLAAILVVRRNGIGVRAFLRVALRWPGRRWALFAALAPMGFLAAGVLLATLLRALGLEPVGPTPASDGSLFGLLLFAPVFMLAFGLGEELGWRGWLLPRVEARFSPLAATLVVALVWAAWHLPLVVDPAAIGKGGPPGILRWAIGMVAGALVLTWMRHRSGSVLACALFHGMLNVASTIVVDRYAEDLAIGLIGLWAVFLAARGAPFAEETPTSAATTSLGFTRARGRKAP